MKEVERWFLATPYPKQCIANAIGGGAGSGGGGSTGTVDYPAYMKTFHGLLLDGGGVDTPSSSVTDALNTALSATPYTSVTAYNPDTDITAMETAISTFGSLANALAYHTDYDAMSAAAVAQYDAVLAPSATYITNKITAYGNDLNAITTSATLATFHAGMRDIGAVLSSAFTIGDAIIASDVTRQIAKFTADIYLTHEGVRIQNVEKGIETMRTMQMNKIEFDRVIAALTVEQKRMKIVVKEDEEKRNTELDMLDAKWDIELFQYASNVLAGIAGAVSTPRGNDGKSTLSSALGGALSGAAAGALVGAQIGSVGGPMGAGIGAAVGIGAALLQ